MLQERGIRARLVQNNDDFNLNDLAEIRYFLKQLDRENEEAIISEDVWNRAKSRLLQVYADSECLSNCLFLLSQFEENYQKYRSDLEAFLRESSLADFYPKDQREVLVSTIHRSKGREFDTVYLLLNSNNLVNEDEIRAIYVAITRARNNLYVYCAGDIFDGSPEIGGIKCEKSYEDYDEPSRVTLQLSFRDVYLDYFISRKDVILRLRSGQDLEYQNGFLIASLDGKENKVASLSAAGIDIVKKYEQRQYEVIRARTRFIVAWRKENDDQETAVILPDIEMRKK